MNKEINTPVYYPILTSSITPQTLILANGDFPKEQFPLSLIGQWQRERNRGIIRLICCDGATNKLRQHTLLPPDAIVGDLDSISKEIKEELASYLHHIPEQETNDLTKAITFAQKEWGCRSVCILGASGGREDHTLSNLSLLSDYRELLDEVVMVTDTGYFRVLKGRTTLEVEIGQQISIYSFVPNNPITARGLRWSLEQRVLPTLWSGTLNRAEQKILEFNSPHPILVFIANEKKD